MVSPDGVIPLHGALGVLALRKGGVGGAGRAPKISRRWPEHNHSRHLSQFGKSSESFVLSATCRWLVLVGE